MTKRLNVPSGYEHGAENIEATQRNQNPTRGNVVLPQHFQTQKSRPQNRGQPPALPCIPSYIEDHLVRSGDATKVRLTPAHLEFLRLHQHLWAGIRDFTVERQMRAIEGWQQLMCTQNDGMKSNEAKPAVQAGDCTDISACRGRSWGPHEVHICDFGGTWL